MTLHLLLLPSSSRTDESWSDGRWSDFLPIIVDCLVDDENQCDISKQKLKPLAWKALEIGLEQVDRFKEGLYPVEIAHEIVWNTY